MLNTDLSMATLSLSLCRKDDFLHPSFVYSDSYKHCTLDGFIVITTNGGLPFYLMDEEQNGKMDGGHAREEIFQTNQSYITK